MSDENLPPLTVETALRRLGLGMPGAVKFRLQNALEHFERSARLIEVDREMASFRAITGEEEAATVLIQAIQLRRYPNAREFNPRDHQHKAAVMACAQAIASTMAPFLGEFQMVFDFAKRRVDIKVPLSNFGVDGLAGYSIQPVEPLDLVHGGPGGDEHNAFRNALDSLAKTRSFASIKKMVSAQANARNGLLYASDAALPSSRATIDDIARRKNGALMLLVLSVMILQSRKHLALVREGIVAFLGVISRLPVEGNA